LLSREARVVGWADLVGVHSPTEAELLERELGASTVQLPLVARSRPAGTSFEDRRELLFVGSAHPPNADAVNHFAHHVLPLIRRRIVDVRFRVVGSVCHLVSQLRRLPGVDLVGPVADLQRQRAMARVFVAPMRYGAGIKGKIVDAIGAGLPVVTTTVGAEGISLVDGESALLADDDAAFATAVVRVYGDRDAWSRLSRKGRELAVEEHSEERLRQAVASFADHLLGVGPRKHRIARGRLPTEGAIPGSGFAPVATLDPPRP
jgi:glycosyltransferase involved in cell wall biosynthesis